MKFALIFRYHIKKSHRLNMFPLRYFENLKQSKLKFIKNWNSFANIYSSALKQKVLYKFDLLFSKISGLCLAKPKNHKMLAIWAQQPTGQINGFFFAHDSVLNGFVKFFKVYGESWPCGNCVCWKCKLNKTQETTVIDDENRLQVTSDKF